MTNLRSHSSSNHYRLSNHTNPILETIIGVKKERPASSKRSQINKGAWTSEEDTKLAEVIAVHGAKSWNTIASKAGLKRCGKSCRLRWMNYLRPDIKRGNISEQEEDLILRLHKLLGNRWSLIAGRLPGRTDNEIKNYWNSHLSKKIKQKEKQGCKDEKRLVENGKEELREENKCAAGGEDSNISFDVDEFFDFSDEKFEWINR
ncbi:transcription factor MYB114-like [Gossypium arboreum]|uniref:Transcription factor MYB114-like n=1 Tax=Gossypium arboreum TaxID=29729 RepID=A0ABR0Q673_GOSAR|nr:transcription factor MYB114-like [Gossypium arboreum]KAK5834732.1 hypothetical protein PVK06_010408 [Gossypium arboreum]